MSIVERIVCGVDGTPAAFEGARQAAALAGDGSQLILVIVEMEASVAAASAAGAGMVPPATIDESGELVEHAAGLLREEFPGIRVESRVIDGPVLPQMLKTLEDLQATLAVVGRHGHSRLAGLVLGSVSTSLLHESPCPVLVAGEREEDAGPFPSSIVVGFDGSEHAERAVGVAVELAHAKNVSLQALCATAGKEVDLDALQARLTELAPGLSLDVLEGKPADVLPEQSCDLLVVGSRGLHGLKALGSVSERVAHHADCSVLVVRPPAAAA